MNSRRSFVHLFLLLFLEAAIYSPSLFHGLVADDYVFHSVASESISHLWTHSSDIHGHWRPFSFSIKYFLFLIFQETAFWWHLLNILTHLGTTLMLYWLLRRFAERTEKPLSPLPLFFAVFFQIHPATVQNVFWIAGFPDLIATLFFLVAAFFLVGKSGGSKPSEQAPLALGMLFYVAALLCKESAIIFPFFILSIGILLAPGKLSLLSFSSWLGKERIAAIAGITMVYLGLFAMVSWRTLIADMSASRPTDWSGVLLRGGAMLAIPTDAFSIYQVFSKWPWAIIPALVPFIVFLAVIIQRPSLRYRVLASLFLTASVSLGVYILAGYIMLRLMYLPVTLMIILLCVIALRGNWPATESRVLGIMLVLLFGVTAFSSCSSVLDWHYADKVTQRIRNAFLETHDLRGKNEYAFAALPSRIRQASIVGEPGTDFNGALRSEGIDQGLPMRQLLRIVLASRDDSSANVRVAPVSATSIDLTVGTPNQYFLFGDIRTPPELSPGSTFSDSLYILTVSETHLGNRAKTVRVESHGRDLENLLLYDDRVGQFLSLEEYLIVQSVTGHLRRN